MVSITDSTHRVIPFPDIPQRVVSLIPSITESLFELGLGRAVAGVSRFCIHPAEQVRSKPRVGGQKDPDLDKIDALSPDLVILNAEENKPEYIKAIGDRYRTWVTYPRTFRDAAALIHDIGRVFRVETKAADYISRIESAAQQRILDRRKTLYLIWRNPWMSVNGDTFIHDVMTLHGLDNVFAERKHRYFEVTEDEIRSADPEIIILPDEPYRFKPKHLVEFSHMDISAVKNNKIFFADGTYFCWYGTRTARASTYIHDNIWTQLK